MHNDLISQLILSQGNWVICVQHALRKELTFLRIGPMILIDGSIRESSQETETLQQIMFDKKLQPTIFGFTMDRE